MESHVFIRTIAFIFALCLTHQSHAITLKIATVAPDGSFWMELLKDGARQIKTETNSRVKFKFYPGGVMGSQEMVLKKMHIGQLHGGAFTSGTLGALHPDSQIYSLPLTFRNLNEVDYVRHRMDEQIIAGLDQAGIITLGISEGGLAYTMSSQPILNIDDFSVHKVWSPNNNTNVELTLEAINVSPVSLSISDVLIGLQTGLIDTVATSPTGAIALQWHTQIKYVTDVPLIYFYSVLAIDDKAFNKIAEDDQRIVRQVMADVVRKLDQKNRENNIAAMEALVNQGIKLVKPDDDQLNHWYEKGSDATQLIFNKGKMSDKAIDSLMTHLQTYRSLQTGLSSQ